VDYYDVTTFSRAYDWMKARGMSEAEPARGAGGRLGLRYRTTRRAPREPGVFLGEIS